MNRGNYMDRAQQNVPISTYGLDFIQRQILLAAEVARIAGYNCILSGCEEAGGNVAPGTLLISGEILAFSGGAKQSKVRIVENVESVTAGTELYEQLYVHRHVEFGANLNNVDTYNWSDFAPVLTNKYINDNKVSRSLRINNRPLSGDINLTPSDIGAATAAQGAKADTAMQSIKTTATLVAPSSRVATNHLIYRMNDIGDFLICGYVMINNPNSTIAGESIEICTLPLRSTYIVAPIPFLAATTLGKTTATLILHQAENARLVADGVAGSVFYTFNFRIPARKSGNYYYVDGI